jgi:hypothetical protein
MTICLFFLKLGAQSLFPIKGPNVPPKWGYQDSLGRVIYYWQFDEADSFNSYGLGRVKKDGKYGLVHPVKGLVLPIEHKKLEPMPGDSSFGHKFNYYYLLNDNLVHSYNGDLYNVDQVKQNQVIRFSYPEDSAIFNQVRILEAISNLDQFKEFSYPSFSKLSFNGIIGYGNRPQISNMLYLERFFRSEEGKSYQIGVGVAHTTTTTWLDKVYNHRNLAIGLVQRFNMSKNWAFNLGVYPVISSFVKQRDRGTMEWEGTTNKHQNLSAYLLGNISAQLFTGVEANFGITYMSTYHQDFFAQGSYFSWGLGFKL